MTNRRTIRSCFPILAATVLCGNASAADGKVRIVQTNSAGDSVSIIDPITHKVVGEIAGIEVNHGAAVAPDGSRIYVSDEAESTLDVADAKTLKVAKRIPLSSAIDVKSMKEITLIRVDFVPKRNTTGVLQ